MLETLLSGPEYVNAMKRAGIYSGLLGWISATRRGEFYPWPDPSPSTAVPTHTADRFIPQPQMRPQNEILHQAYAPTTLQRPMVSRTAPPLPSHHQQLAVIPPPKRALDVLHESYHILGIDDSKPLTHEGLRLAYKRAAVRAHPDKGGTPEDFDAVTRAFLYLQEVLDKLIPKTAADGSDPRFTAAVTPETALKARGVYSTATATAPAPPGAARIEDAPPIALNPKKLDMAVFNQLFEQNKLPDPDKDDGYGDWLKSQEARSAGTSATAMRGKYNKDIFNKTFEEEAKRQAASDHSALTSYRPPSDLIMAPEFGTELGSDRPQSYTKAANGSGIGYTDLKQAYTEKATFSQEVAGVRMDGRPKTLEEAKREYGNAPQAMTAEQAAAVAAFEQAKAAAEAARQRRAAARDVDAAAFHDRLKNRLMISQ
jgi:curved DNA-binding protein CbpA